MELVKIEKYETKRQIKKNTEPPKQQKYKRRGRRPNTSLNFVVGAILVIALLVGGYFAIDLSGIFSTKLDVSEELLAKPEETDVTMDTQTASEILAANDPSLEQESDPVDTTQSVNGADPIDTTQPIDGADPIDTTQPIDGTDTIDTTQPVDGADPIDTTQPVDGTDSTDMTQQDLSTTTTPPQTTANFDIHIAAGADSVDMKSSMFNYTGFQYNVSGGILTGSSSLDGGISANFDEKKTNQI